MAEPTPLSTETAQDKATVARPSPRVDSGRVSVYAALGASAGAVPLPWVPDVLVRRVRGALVHDLAAQHGVSLTREARDVLAEPSASPGGRSLLGQALRFVGTRLAVRSLTALGPIGFFWPMQNAFQTYVLGRLFERYLSVWRTERAVRVDAEEARRVRGAIDGALMRSIGVAVEAPPEPRSMDDDRDLATAVIDGLLALAAGIPARLTRRLDAAFDDVIGHEPR
jgi:uncharacterized protein (DUF697 family)